jgi:hypothetical protein
MLDVGRDAAKRLLDVDAILGARLEEPNAVL